MAEERTTTEIVAIERDPSARVLAEDESESFHERWDAIQSSFIDEPRRSVAEADRLVQEVTGRITERFEQERDRLESTWESGEEVTTEDLRIALQRYRTFFDRLLRI